MIRPYLLCHRFHTFVPKCKLQESNRVESDSEYLFVYWYPHPVQESSFHVIKITVWCKCWKNLARRSNIFVFYMRSVLKENWKENGSGNASSNTVDYKWIYNDHRKMTINIVEVRAKTKGIFWDNLETFWWGVQNLVATACARKRLFTHCVQLLRWKVNTLLVDVWSFGCQTKQFVCSIYIHDPVSENCEMLQLDIPCYRS